MWKTAEKVVGRKKRPETALGALLGASEKESRFSKVFSKEAQKTSDLCRKAFGRGNGRISMFATPLN